MIFNNSGDVMYGGKLFDGSSQCSYAPSKSKLLVFKILSLVLDGKLLIIMVTVIYNFFMEVLDGVDGFYG